jgi:4'-phosphopantetheinyl transferase
VKIPTTLPTGQLLVIRARLDAQPLSADELRAVTSPEEQARASRFHQGVDAARHLIGRGLLRRALAPHTGLAPEAIRFLHTADGKPYLADGPSFNVSHSGNVVAIALAGDGRVGFDVEAVRVLDDMAGVARSAFGADECDELAGTPSADRLHTFYRIWARKEAMLKALGLGLSALSMISVSGAEGFGNSLVRLDAPHESLDGWTLRSIQSPADTESAVAWDRPLVELEIVDL